MTVASSASPASRPRRSRRHSRRRSRSAGGWLAFAWGHGYATEAGRAALRFGFEERDLAEILSWTARLNTPSIAVMERLGMRRDPLEDFDHPRVPDGDPLRPHVLYRIGREAWAASASERPG